MRWCALVVMIASSTAVAEPPAGLSAEARAHLDAGKQLFAEKRYDDALAEFRAGYGIEPDPVFLYNEAQVQRFAGDCKTAIETYRAFLATDPPGEEAHNARYNMGVCVDELARHPAPPEPPPPVRTETRVLIVQKGPWYRDTLGVTLVAAGIASTGVTAGALVLAHRRANEADAAVTFGTYDTEARAADHDRTIAIAAGAVGGAFLLAGALRIAFRPSHTFAAAPIVTGTGAGMSLVGEF